ncbi:VQ motif-containing protein 4-like [Miscanthus floridulus]|uniref:VQ motif-containing protein 4-like n=1 Tax=Miscanthus floridulus TaxID=154761 RepID=UPI003457ABAE
MDAGAATTARERPAPPLPVPMAIPLPVPLPQASVDPSNPFPTTFVQADTTSFKQVVQILTGTPETAAAAASGEVQASPPAPQKPAPTPPGPKKPAFKLYERRSSMKSLKMLCPLLPAAAAFAAGGFAGGFSPRGFSPRGLEVLSPSMLDFPSMALGSPVTPLPPLPGSEEAAAAEDRAIAEKGFYLHPSPRGNAGAGGDLQPPPRLLPLFPVQSPTGRP